MYLRLGAMNYNYYSYTYFKIIAVYLDVTEMYFPMSHACSAAIDFVEEMVTLHK